MTPFLLYIGRSSLYLALFYAFFLLVMRRTTFFRLNRILLLAGTVTCFLLPVLRLRSVEVPFLMAGPLTEAASEPALTAGPSAASPFPYLELLYILGILAVLGWTAVAMVRMYRTIRKGAATRLDSGIWLILTEADIPSFSWGRTIVMSRKDSEQNPVIRLHEEAHIRKAHTLDILLFTAVTLVHWFNPLVWITLSELKLLHEYEADDAVLNHGIDATQYQLLLVRKAVGDKRFTLANGSKPPPPDGNASPGSPSSPSSREPCSCAIPSAPRSSPPTCPRRSSPKRLPPLSLTRRRASPTVKSKSSRPSREATPASSPSGSMKTSSTRKRPKMRKSKDA